MTVTTVLALATLGDTTQIGLFLFFVVLPKVAKASTGLSLSHVIVVSVIAPTFANVNLTLQLVKSGKDLWIESLIGIWLLGIKSRVPDISLEGIGA